MSDVYDVIEAVQKNRLSRIRTANGYLTDIGGNIFIGREDFSRHDVLPALSVLFQEDDPAEERIGCGRIYTEGLFHIVVSAVEDPAQQTLLQLRDYHRDLIQALFSPDDMYSEGSSEDIFDGIYYAGQFVVPRTSGGTLARMGVSVMIGWHQILGVQ